MYSASLRQHTKASSEPSIQVPHSGDLIKRRSNGELKRSLQSNLSKSMTLSLHQTEHPSIIDKSTRSTDNVQMYPNLVSNLSFAAPRGRSWGSQVVHVRSLLRCHCAWPNAKRLRPPTAVLKLVLGFQI